jgi:hypothetical protein
MQPNSPITQSPISPAAVFGFNYQPQKFCHTEAALSTNIIPRLDFARVEKHCKRWAVLYTHNLMHMYPDFINKKSGRWNHDPKYNELNIGKSEMATLKLLLTFFAGYLGSQRDKSNKSRMYQPFQINGAMLRAKGLGSVKTYTNHFYVLEQAGFFKRLPKECQNERYETIIWNARFIKWLRDPEYQRTVSTKILLKHPELPRKCNFEDYQKRLKQPVFWVADPVSPKIFRTLQYNWILSNSSPKAELFISGGNYVSHQTPFLDWNKETEPQKTAAEPKSLGRAAAASKDDISVDKSKNNSSYASLNAEKKAWADKAFSLMIGILWKWFGQDFTSGKIPEAQVDATKEWIAYWLFENNRKDTREYVYGYFLPVLMNLRRRNNKQNAWKEWIPKLYLYFDPHWERDDGGPIGYRKAMQFYDDNQQRIEQKRKMKKLLAGVRKKMRTRQEREQMFFKCFDFVWSNPSEKNYIKARNKILKYDDREVLINFYQSVRSAKLLSHRFMEMEKTRLDIR